MAGRPIFINIANQHKYENPDEIIKRFHLFEEKRTDRNGAEWDNAQGSVMMFHNSPEEWWAIRRTPYANSSPILDEDTDRSIEIPLEELADKSITDCIWDWLHDDNLQNDVYITHYRGDREVTTEITTRKRHGFFMKEETETVIETQKIMFVGFLFINPEDTVQFKLACL